MEQTRKHPMPEIPTSLLPDWPEIPPHDPRMDDLYAVGPDKPLGYLPIKTIHIAGENPDAVAELSRERGLSVVFQDPNEEEIRKGDMGKLFAYDELALNDLLQQNASVLERHKWPTEVQDFVAKVSVGHVDPKRQADLYKLIARAYKDPRPEHARPQAGESLALQQSASWLGRLATFGLRK